MYNIENALNATELYALKRLHLCYVNFIPMEKKTLYEEPNARLTAPCTLQWLPLLFSRKPVKDSHQFPISFLSKVAQWSKGMYPLQGQFRAIGFCKLQTREFGLTSMGFTSEISPALENLWLGVAGVPGKLYFQVCSGWGGRSRNFSELPYLTLQGQCSWAGRDFMDHLWGNGNSRKVNTFSQVPQPVNGWAGTRRKGTIVDIAPTPWAGASGTLPQPLWQTALGSSICRWDSGRFRDQADIMHLLRGRAGSWI